MVTLAVIAIPLNFAINFSMRDSIFVIGRSVNRKPNKYSTQRALVAECIYREDWLNFYKAGGATNPQDYEDVYRELMKDYDE